MRTFSPLTAPVDPVTALSRIAWLLERDRQRSYRVEAFRKAAGIVAAMDDDELGRRLRASTLTEVSGIGTATASVITAASAGELPGYLDRLQQTPSPMPDAPTLVPLLRGDLHSHTDWSDGGAPPSEMAAAASELGYEWLAVTDHSPRLTIAHGLSAQRLAQQIDVIDAWNRTHDDGLTLLRGIEVDILDDGSLDQEPALLDRLDVVTASVHSKLRMDAPAMTRRLVAAASNPRVQVLGHCTGRLIAGRGRPPSTFDAQAVFEACAAAGTAVEINSRPERVDPPDELLTLARDLGCLFAIDSDAHAPGQLEFTRLGAVRAVQHGIDPDRIVTTWPLPRLREWAGTPLA
ncbi:PHP domain-containing protein [Gordonia alkaliphila]|uniref:PHP domain-containing protein n=1 Tax=Gordonia alkaliphila TaxID=1053547 RepID=UPI001FF2178C|nr:PHP domain-containing protein [Gordonia alkaliphila]MCK0438191.1 PHP domain-containing protein [Gordonia alkaliphila]